MGGAYSSTCFQLIRAEGRALAPRFSLACPSRRSDRDLRFFARIAVRFRVRCEVNVELDGEARTAKYDAVNYYIHADECCPHATTVTVPVVGDYD